MTAMPTDHAMRGIGYMILSACGFSAMSVTAKWLTADYPVPQIVFFRSLFVVLPTLAMILMRRNPALFRTQHLRGHFVRSMVGTISMFCMFYSYHFLPLADAVAVGFMGPVFSTLFAIILLREPAYRRHWLALGAGLVGVIVMTQPGAGTVNWLGLGIALAGALFYGLAHTHIRRLGRTESPLTTVCFFALFATAATGMLLPWFWRQPTLLDLALMCLTGCCAFIGQLFLTKAYQCAPAATVSPFNYTGLIWAVIFGYLLWDEQPTPHIVCGAAIVMVAGIYLAWKERRPHVA